MAVVVVGAGIGGLTMALSLHQAGIACEILEAVEAVAPLGVGINLLPHAVRELTELGLQAELAELGIETAELAYYSKHGNRIWAEPRGKSAGYHWPQFSIHRGELQMLLYRTVLDRLGPECLRLGAPVTDWTASDDVVAVHGEDASGQRFAVRGELLIAADGIHSAIRSRMYPDEGAPIWNGAVLWRGVTESTPFLTGRSMIMAGHEFQKFVCYPISRKSADAGRSLLNWVAERKFDPDDGWRREDWNRSGVLDEFLPQFESWRFSWLDVPGLIRGATHCYEYPMVDRDPLESWTRHRVTLLGDAAHPMYPIGSNGASQAILDARFLTRELLCHGLEPAALLGYEAQRRPATSKIVLANRGNGPEQVMQLVEERAPDGFERIEQVLSQRELEDTAGNYKRIAGFDKDELNQRGSIVAGR